MTPYSFRNDVERLVTEYVRFNNDEHINRKDGLTAVEISSKAA